MANEDYQFQNILHYSRKTFKNRSSIPLEVYTSSRREDANEELPDSQRSDKVTIDASPGCSCENDPDEEIASILHKKCPVIALAQRQLHKLLDETDKLLCDNTRCCR
ncbi:jg8182 [Pararge aegeria aegeria]|uniref:Jg8182 protein n=2 Tax=Pararge aegeria TaxID=116150 RepID=A0A8S4SQ27_9NEOP|nr:jg8182 [Pararge aegeria aegeria]